MALKSLVLLKLLGTVVDALSLVNVVENGASGEHMSASETEGPPTAWNHDVLNLKGAPTIITGNGWYNDWSLCGVNTVSNLDGVGPESEKEHSLRFKNIGKGKTVDGTKIKYDLVVTADSKYWPNDPELNGLGMGGCFGMINLRSETDVELLFAFYESGTNNSVALERSFFTVFDLDTNKGGVVKEQITIYDTADAVYYEPDAALDISGDLESVGGLTFTANDFGTGSDNPKDPSKLSKNQRRRTVMAEYSNATVWRVRFSLLGEHKGGRNFAFASMTNMGPGVPTSAPTALAITTTGPSKASTTGGGGSRQTPTPLPTPAPTTTTTSCTTSSCQVYADPHVSGFDNSDNQGPAHLMLIDDEDGGEGRLHSRSHTFDKRPVDVNALETGDFWLVKSDSVRIQARFRLSGEFIPDRAAVGAVAVGGPFLNGHQLLVEPLDGSVTLDGVDLIDGVHTHPDGFTIQQNRESGDVRAELPLQVTLEFKRLPKHIDLKITMPPPSEGVDGECGNYDGIPENDEETYIRDRMGSVVVPEAERMFATTFDDVQGSTLKGRLAQLVKSFGR